MNESENITAAIEKLKKDKARVDVIGKRLVRIAERKHDLDLEASELMRERRELLKSHGIDA